MRTTFFNLLLLSSPVFATPVFIGTGADGIYLTDFDAATGKLTEPKRAAEYKGPGWIEFHPSKPILYTIGSPNTPFEDKSGAVAAFKIGEGNSLEFISETSSGGQGPCHIVTDGRVLAVANYGNGNFATIKLDENGALGKPVSVITKKGEGPHPRQKGPHSHGVYIPKAAATATGDGWVSHYLLEPDLGLDRVFIYDVNINTGEAKPSSPEAFGTKPGAGPRHLAISPDGKSVYVINELDNTIQVSSSDGEGAYEVIQTVPTLPADFEGKSTTSEIEVHPNGKFVYGSNRGHDSIAVYSRDTETGKLTLVQHAPCGGKTPRHFKIDPSGKWMLIGHQDSNTISVLPLDVATGKLGEPGSTVSAPKPICLLFGK